MAGGRKFRFMGGRFGSGDMHDPLRDMVGQVWREIDHDSVQMNAADVSPALEEDLSPSTDLIDPKWMKERTVLLPGVGAVGSRNSNLLAPYGVTQILIDHDTVELRNTLDGRTEYSREDIGKPKVSVLRDRNARIYPDTRIIAHQRNVNDISAAELQHWARESDAGLIAIDEGKALFHWNTAMYPEAPMFYQGVHRHGRSGQVIITRPGSPCLKCCMGVHMGDDVVTLHGEAALGIHFGAIAQVGAQLVIQELAASRGSILGAPLDPEVSVLFVTNMATELTPHGPGVIPFQVERDPACDVCGN